MGNLIDEDVMREFSVVAEPDGIAAGIKSRFGNVVDRTSAAYAQLPKEARARIIRELTAA